MKIRVGTWNMASGFRTRGSSEEAWVYLDGLGLDFGLVQEASPPADRNTVVPKEIYRGKRWGSGIVNYTRYDLVPIRGVRLGDSRRVEQLQESHPGAAVAADVRLDTDVVLTLISIYGLLDQPLRNEVRYATTTVHRMLSDLTPVLDLARKPNLRVLLGGDLNISPQIRPPDTKHHQLVIDRIKAFGLVDCLGATHDGYVRTLRHRSRIDSAPFQGDWLFMSPNLKLLSCEAIDHESAWALSDHCPVVAEVDIE
jgi:hypothetical protein